MVIRGLVLPLATYRSRRAKAARLLAKAFGRPVPLLLIGNDEGRLRRDRQDPWFDYYSGCLEPDAALIVDPTRDPRDTLFLDPGDPKRVIWDGPRLGPGAQAKRAHGVQAVASAHDLEARVLAAAKRAKHRIAMCTREREPGAQAEAFARWKKKLRGIEVLNAEPHLVHQRMYKDADEVALHRQAIEITRKGLAATLPRIPKLANEAEVASELTMHYRKHAYGPLAFPPIVGSAVDGATLHYPHNDQPLVKGAPLLIDSGATAGGYCADVTRTVPQHGRFDDKRFREVYELVLRCNALGREHCRPGITREELNEIAWKPIIDAGFIRHHGLSHHIGLDVHDPADYTIAFKPGMIISNEPGVYLPDEGFGIRIEDDLLVTADGCEELTRAIPKDVKGLEAAMRG
ncbi:MAG TPA: Xaa-Pro peptidase family protein [Planctomycetota bacterium]|nr:Xaa-Pro peptidase family protein [Planctomycetota bacterium]